MENSKGRYLLAIPGTRFFGLGLMILTATALSSDVRAQYLPPIPQQDSGFVYPPRGITGDLWADTILGQIDFSNITPNQAVSNMVGKVSGVLVDAAHNRLFAYDSEDSRVYVFNDISEFQPNNSQLTGYGADFVLGQPDFSRTGCNWDGDEQDVAMGGPVTTAPTAYSLCSVPENVASLQETGSYANMAVDSQGNLYVPDMWNERVLRYNMPITVNGQAAASVWGQADFSSFTSNRGNAGPSNNTFFFTRIGGTTNGLHAGVAVDSNDNLWVADIGNNRVLRFPNSGGAGGYPDSNADLVLGQPDFTTLGGNTFNVMDTTQLRCPIALRVDSQNNVYVVDYPGTQGRMIVYQNPVTNNTPGSYAVTQYLSDPTGIEFDAPAPVGTGGVWVTDSGEDAIINFLNGAAQKVLFRDSFSAVTQYTGEPVGEPGIVGDNGNQSVSYTYPPGDYNWAYFMGFPGSSVGVDSSGDVFVAGGTQWNDVWRFPAPIPYPTPGVAHSADVEIFKPTQKYIQNFIGDWGMYQPEGVAVVWGSPAGSANAARQIIVSTETRLMFWNLPDGSVTGLSNGQIASGIAGTNAPLERALPGFDGYATGSTYQRIREDKDTTQQHLYAVGSNDANPNQGINEILVFDLPLTANAAPVTALSSPSSVLGGGTLNWGGPDGVATDPSDPTGSTLWVADTAGNRVFRVRNPLTHPVVDIVLGQPNLTSTSCNTGGISNGMCSNSQPTASTFSQPGEVSMDHQGNVYVSDDAFESNGNFRMMRWNKSQLPVTQTTCLFAIPATFIYGTPGNSPTLAGGSGVLNDVSAPTEAAFTSDDKFMVVGGLFDDFAQVLINPAQGDSPVTHTNDFASQPYSAAFDDQNNLYLVDATRNRLLIYQQPFFTPSPTPTSTATPQSPTATFTPSPTATVTTTPTATPTPFGPPCLYPNPVRGSNPIHLRLGLSSAVQVKVKIFTTAFRKIRETPYQVIQPGQEILLNPVDDQGKPLANGLYYVAAQTAQQRIIQKLLVLR